MAATSHLLQIADEGPAENTTQRRPYLDERRQDGHLFQRNRSSDRGGGGVTRPRHRGESLELRGCTQPRQLRVFLFSLWQFPELIGHKSITRA